MRIGTVINLRPVFRSCVHAAWNSWEDHSVFATRLVASARSVDATPSQQSVCARFFKVMATSRVSIFLFFFQLMDFYDPASANMRSPTSLFTLQRQEITPITSSGTPVIRTRRGASPFSARGMKSSRDHWRCCFTLAKWAGPVPGDDVRWRRERAQLDETA